MKNLKAIDLFCGAGGTTVGLQKAGFEVISAIDNDSWAIATYKLNHGERVDHLVEGDIQKINLNSYKKRLGIKKNELDLLAACPPCQGFSRIRRKTAKELSANDPRNKLVLEYIKFVKAFMPKTLMLENVPGLKNDNRMKRLQEQLEKLGYEVNIEILDAADYGVPQRRKRLILLGSRVGEVKHAVPLRKKVTVKDVLFDLEKAGRSRKWMHNRLTKYNPKVLNIIKMIPKNGGLRSDLAAKYQLPCHKRSKGFKDVYGRMKWNEPAPTITCGCTSASKGRFIHPKENRAITLYEALILQNFPKNYRFPKQANNQELARLIGNAFPPKFIEVHAREIYKILV